MSVVPSLHPPSGRVAIERELPALFIALAAPVVTIVAIVPPVAGEPLGADSLRDRDRAATPEDSTRGGVSVDVDFLRSFQKAEDVLGAHAVLGGPRDR